MPSHRVPIGRDDLAAMLEEIAEEICDRTGSEGMIPADLYVRQADAVLGLLDQLRIGVDPVGLTEIAERCGTSRPTIETWRYRYDHFPQPRWRIGGRPAWDWPDIEDWGRATGRLRENGRWAAIGEVVA